MSENKYKNLSVGWISEAKSANSDSLKSIITQQARIVKDLELEIKNNPEIKALKDDLKDKMEPYNLAKKTCNEKIGLCSQILRERGIPIDSGAK